MDTAELTVLTCHLHEYYDVDVIVWVEGKEDGHGENRMEEHW